VAVLLATAPALAATDPAVSKGASFYLNATDVFVTWNVVYQDDRPFSVNPYGFVAGAVRCTVSGANMTIDYYNPSNLYSDNGTGFVFTFYPHGLRRIEVTIEGIPVGVYEIVRETSNGATSYTVEVGKRLVISDYIDRPTTYTVKMLRFEGLPKVKVTVPIPKPTKKAPTLWAVPASAILFLLARRCRR